MILPTLSEPVNERYTSLRSPEHFYRFFIFYFLDGADYSFSIGYPKPSLIKLRLTLRNGRGRRLMHIVIIR
jgi:hypothetical protein